MRGAVLGLLTLVACDVAPARKVAAPDPVPTGIPRPVTVLPAPPASAAPGPARVVLVTIDGIRWEDALGDGRGPSLMPNLVRIVGDRGTALGGAGCTYDVRASGPNFVSLPGYVEMFTGRASACTSNGCASVTTETILDRVRARSDAARDVAVFASWDTYARAVARDRALIVLSAGGSKKAIAAGSFGGKDDAKLRLLLEVGAANTGYPGWGDYRPDVHTTRIALRYLETVMPKVLVVGLGDPDELAHRGDFAAYRRAMQHADDFLVDLQQTLARMGVDGSRTAVLVTTDHGRGHGAKLRSHGSWIPESQRVFVAAFGHGIAHRGVACPSEPLRLADVAGTMSALLALSRETSDGPLAAELLAER